MSDHTEYKISGVSVHFPCRPYPSQFSMMDKIIKGIDRRQNCLLESPTGSGKSLALLCSSLAWQVAEKEKRDKEEEDVASKEDCKCACHTQKSPKCQTSVSVEDIKVTESAISNNFNWNSSVEQSKSGCPTDEDDDFIAVKKFNLPSARKSPRKRMKIAYEDTDEDHIEKILVTVGEILQGEKQEAKVVPVVAECKLCTCDSSGPTSKARTKIPKIYFGTRTHKQVAQIVRELRKTQYSDVRMTILGSREHTCIHPEVSKMKAKNDGCRELLNGPGCRFKDSTQRFTSQTVVKGMGLNTAWDIEDLVQLCKVKKACPYFLSRGLKDEADLIICPYNYLIDPIIRDAMAISLKGHVVILDEAHNIEDAAREAASQSITQESIVKAVRDIEILIERNIDIADYSKLRAVLHNLDSFIDENKSKLEQKDFDRAYKIWSAFHIVAQLESLGLGPKNFPNLKTAYTSVKSAAEERKEESFKNGLTLDLLEMKPTTDGLLTQIFQVLEYLYRADMKYVDDYRASLVQSYQFSRVSDGQWLNAKNGFNGRNYQQESTAVYTLNFWCMNPGVAFSDFAETRSIILTSGTLSPLNSFQSELGLSFSIQLEANHVIRDSQVWVGTIGSGPTGGKLQAVFRNLETFAYQDELGGLVLRVCEIVPYGVLCFLPSYKVLEKVTSRWESTGLMKKLSCIKKIIKEPRGSDKSDFEGQMDIFYEAMKTTGADDEEANTNGAIFFAVCRGKVSEGLDFADNFARAVISVGIPFPNYKDVQVEQKRQYNDNHRKNRGLLSGQQWYEIQGFRALNQALGRCIRHRQDWGALIIVDERFLKDPPKYCNGLSKWVRNKIQPFQEFSKAMNSLCEFITVRMEADKESKSDISLFSSPCVNPTPRTPLHEITPLHETTPDQCFNVPVTQVIQQNFSIFSSMKSSKKEIAASGITVEVKKRGMRSKSNELLSGNNLTPSQKLSQLIKRQLSVGPQTPGSCADNPIEVGGVKSDEDVSKKQNLSCEIASDLVLTPVNQKRLPNQCINISDPGQLSVSPASVVETISGPGDKVQLRILTEVAEPGQSAHIFEIPEQLHVLFGGNIRLPLSNKIRLVYIIEPPASSGLKPSARIIKMSEEEKDRMLALHHSSSSLFSPDAVKANTLPETQQVLPQSGPVSEARNLSVLGSMSNCSTTQIPVSAPTVSSESRSHQMLSALPHNKAKPTVRQTLFVTPTKETAEPNHTQNPLNQTPFKVGPDVEVTSPLCEKSSLKVGTTAGECSSSSPLPSDDRPNRLTQHPNISNPSNHALSSDCVDLPAVGAIVSHAPTTNKKRLFKLQKSPTEVGIIGAGVSHLVNPTPKTPARGGAALEASDQEVMKWTKSPLSTFVAPDADEKKAESQEEEILIRRKSKRRTSLTQTGGRKKCRGDNRRSESLTCANKARIVAFKCSNCGSVLLGDKRDADFQALPNIPEFLQGTSATTQGTNHSCIFFPANTAREGLEAKPSLNIGLNTKYIEQEEICVQFLYCGQCIATDSQSIQPAGAQVQLAANARARFSKGQIWLFSSQVQQEDTTPQV